MGMTLRGVGGEFDFGVSRWRQILRLASAYGWQPAGTVFNERKAKLLPGQEWSAGYETNDEQIVTAQDARNIADALEQALADLPASNDVGARRNFDATGTTAASTTDKARLLAWLREQSGQEMRQFIAFCRAGDFEIG